MSKKDNIKRLRALLEAKGDKKPAPKPAKKVESKEKPKAEEKPKKEKKVVKNDD